MDTLKDNAEWHLYELEKMTNEVHPTVYIQIATAFALGTPFPPILSFLDLLFSFFSLN